QDCLDAAAFNYNLKVHAYVLMPNQVHILATPGQADSISRSVQSIGRNYVQYFNECHDSEGTIWEGRYRATVLDSKEYLLECCRLIEMNPVRAGLSKNPKDYPWSSYQFNASVQTSELITPHSTYLNLGSNDKERAAAYRTYLRQKMDPELIKKISEATLKGWALGDSRFIRKIEKATGRRATPLPKGRPKRKS
ncbi:MAG: transposase, partial [Pseudomonadota bacterium]